MVPLTPRGERSLSYKIHQLFTYSIFLFGSMPTFFGGCFTVEVLSSYVKKCGICIFQRVRGTGL